ncbi:M48 family metallopeptidase [Candidatus Gracilibacteria bacterium]|nr:M48 family metallopeptidase [Candidatus Gracilibacteria bacterium]
MKIVKSFRKSMSMSFDKDGVLIVKAPFFVTQKTILDFVEKNKSWIEKTKTKISLKNLSFDFGESYYLFGESYKLLSDSMSEKIIFDGTNFYLNIKYKNKIKEKLLEFYKLKAQDYIKNRARELSILNNLEFSQVKITSAKTRWGSCTSKKNINFSFRLIMSPKQTIDYVIIHELSHLLEMNHSPKFWKNVDIFFQKLGHGNYKHHQNWLKINGNKLMYV